MNPCPGRNSKHNRVVWFTRHFSTVLPSTAPNLVSLNLDCISRTHIQDFTSVFIVRSPETTFFLLQLPSGKGPGYDFSRPKRDQNPRVNKSRMYILRPDRIQWSFVCRSVGRFCICQRQSIETPMLSRFVCLRCWIEVQVPLAMSRSFQYVRKTDLVVAVDFLNKIGGFNESAKDTTGYPFSVPAKRNNSNNHLIQAVVDCRLFLGNAALAHLVHFFAFTALDSDWLSCHWSPVT